VVTRPVFHQDDLVDLGLAGRRYVVTGGSRGIGRAIVELLLDEGARVATCARSDPGWGPEVPARSGDVRDREWMRAFVAEAAETFGGLDGSWRACSTWSNPPWST
jgi:NAD(P)-dependent dehydrogenase (short-subunit alcohol dehydrogenase family)